MRTLILTTTTVFAFASAPTLANECTQEMVQEKAMEVSTRIQELAATDPQKVTDLMPKVQEGAARFQTNPDLETACQYYDELLAEMES